MNVRISYPSLWHKAIFDTMKTEEEKLRAKYSATLIIDDNAVIRQRANKSEPWKQLTVKDILTTVEGLCAEMWKGKKMSQKSFQVDNFFLKDGSAISAQSTEPKPEYEGFQLVKASNWNRPKILNRAAEVLSDEDSDKIYAGCRVNASIVLQPWEGGGKKGVRAVLNGVQFAGDDKPFGSAGCNEEDEFDAAEVDAFEADGDDEL